MRKFCIKLTLFAAILLGLLLVVRQRYVKLYPPEDNFYLASLDKSLLLGTQASPRLIFIGGSSMAFGMDSGLVASRCGYHPVNMGLHLGIGLEFMLQEVEPFLRRGDVVLIGPEYSAFTTYFRAQPEFIARVVESRPDLLRLLTAAQMKSLLDRGFVQHLGRVIRVVGGRSESVVEISDAVYRRRSFNLNGDFVGHHGLPSPGAAGTRFRYTGPVESQAAIERLNSFQQYCQRYGVRVFLSHPPFADQIYQPSEPAILALEVEIRAKLRIPFLDEPGELKYPSDQFFDTAYHLNEQGKRRRSEFVAERLAAALRLTNAPPTEAR